MDPAGTALLRARSAADGYPDAGLAEVADPTDPTDPADPAVRYEVRESVELAFVASLQKLPATQRAVVIMREVLGFPAAEVAVTLDTTVASVNSALQRARQTLGRSPETASQQAVLRDLGEDNQRALVDAFVDAWERGDVEAVVDLLAEDARFTMPPLPAWFGGRDDVRRFVRDRLVATPWRLVPIGANGQLAFACYQGGEPGAPFRLTAVNVLTLRGGEIVELSGFIDPGILPHFDLPAELG